ncbi:MAG: DEAD/DEAH box helicase [Thermoplasmata archaeon]
MDPVEKFKELLKKLGIDSLYPPQELAIKKIFEGKSVVVSMPTASGKTLIAYAAIIRALSLNMKALYVVPLRALAMEKYDELKELIGNDYKIILSIGDYDSSSKELKGADVVVAVYEKIDSVLRHDFDYLYSVGVIVVDEIHMIQDDSRGPTLEMVLSKIKYIKSNLQLIALSATIKNYEEIAQWLEAEHIYSDFRPVPLRIGLYHDGMLEFDDGEIEYIKEDKIKIGNLVKRSLENGGQVLIFVSRRSYAESLAEKLRPIVDNYIKEFEIPNSIDEEKNLYDEKIKENIKHGVCFHHAGLSNSQRKYVEMLFKERKIKCLVATPTLAAGVNLPARSVIVRDITRYSQDGFTTIPSFEINQMLGRAGRPKYDSFGEGIVVSKKGYVDLESLLQIYDISSKLGNFSALRMHVLGIISSGLVNDEESIPEFFKNTFLGYKGLKEVEFLIKDTISFLENEELIRSFRGIRPTPLGKLISDLYIDPMTGISFKNSLEFPYADVYALYVVSSAEEMIPLISKEGEFEFPNHPGFEDKNYDALKTAMMLLDWSNEIELNEILNKYGIGPGDVHMRVEIADWLLYSYSKIAYMLKSPYAQKIETLWKRIKYGVKEELIDLVSLTGIGRVRARTLFNFGYKTLESIADADPEKLSKIPGIGEKISNYIVKEAKNINLRKKNI